MRNSVKPCARRILKCSLDCAVFCTVLILPTILFAEPPWPSDFDSQVEKRIAEHQSVNATVVTADMFSYDTISGFPGFLDGIGDIETPFDSRVLSWGVAWNAWLLTKPPVGFSLILR